MCRLTTSCSLRQEILKTKSAKKVPRLSVDVICQLKALNPFEGWTHNMCTDFCSMAPVQFKPAFFPKVVKSVFDHCVKHAQALTTVLIFLLPQAARIRHFGSAVCCCCSFVPGPVLSVLVRGLVRPSSEQIRKQINHKRASCSTDRESVDHSITASLTPALRLTGKAVIAWAKYFFPLCRRLQGR